MDQWLMKPVIHGGGRTPGSWKATPLITKSFIIPNHFPQQSKLGASKTINPYTVLRAPIWSRSTRGGTWWHGGTRAGRWLGCFSSELWRASYRGIQSTCWCSTTTMPLQSAKENILSTANSNWPSLSIVKSWKISNHSLEVRICNRSWIFKQPFVKITDLQFIGIVAVVHRLTAPTISKSPRCREQLQSRESIVTVLPTLINTTLISQNY